MAVKSFITLAPGCSVINLYSSSLITRTNKLEHLSFVPCNPFYPGLLFVGNTRSLPKKDAPERGSTQVGSGLRFHLKTLD